MTDKELSFDEFDELHYPRPEQTEFDQLAERAPVTACVLGLYRRLRRGGFCDQRRSFGAYGK